MSFFEIFKREKVEETVEEKLMKYELENEKMRKKARKEARELEKRMEGEYARKFYFEDILKKNNFVVDKTVQSGVLQWKRALFVDSKNKRFAIAFDNFGKRDISFYDFSDLLYFELNEDGIGIIQGKRGSPVIDISMKTKIKGMCNYMAVHLFLNDSSRPERVIGFIREETENDSFTYICSLKEAREVTDVLIHIQANS